MNQQNFNPGVQMNPNGTMNIWASQPTNWMMPQNAGFGNPPPVMNWNQPVIPMQPSQPAQPQPQNPVTINCRVINNIEEIKPNEINGNGIYSFFIMDDLSKIYAKRWNKDGGIDNLVFNLDIPEPPITVTEERKTLPEFNQIMERIEDMYALINSRMPAQPGQNSKKTSTKKEDLDNG